MIKHTPGEWILEDEPHRHFWRRSCDYKLVASIPVGGNKNSDEQKLQKIADAILISFAPDLLEALESVKQCGFDDEDGSGWGVIHITRGELDAVLTAIAKAKGDQA